MFSKPLEKEEIPPMQLILNSTITKAGLTLNLRFKI